MLEAGFSYEANQEASVKWRPQNYDKLPVGMIIAVLERVLMSRKDILSLGLEKFRRCEVGV